MSLWLTAYFEQGVVMKQSRQLAGVIMICGLLLTCTYGYLRAAYGLKISSPGIVGKGASLSIPSTNRVPANKIMNLNISSAILGERLEIECSEAPFCTSLGQDKAMGGNMTQKAFFIPGARLSRTASAVARTLAEQSRGVYTFQCLETKKPIPGVTLLICYNVTQQEVHLVSWPPLDSKKGMVVVIMNKNSVEELLKKTDNVLHYAYGNEKNVGFYGFLRA